MYKRNGQNDEKLNFLNMYTYISCTLVWLCWCARRGVGGLAGPPFLRGDGEGGFLAASATAMFELYSLKAVTRQANNIDFNKRSKGHNRNINNMRGIHVQKYM